jgi:hypothetical protein
MEIKNIDRESLIKKENPVIKVLFNLDTSLLLKIAFITSIKFLFNVTLKVK